jgi:hypothetical protein
MKKVKFLSVLFIAFLVIGSVSCDKDDNDDPTPTSNNNSNNNNNSSDTTVVLDDVTDGMGKASMFGDTTFTMEGSATWKENGSININGKAHSVWLLTMEGQNQDEELTLRIIEEDNNSTMAGPDDGTYQIGSGMTENEISVRTENKSYSSDLSSTGSFTLEQSDNGNVLEIVLNANQLELGGIGSQDEHIDVNGAFKATKN